MRIGVSSQTYSSVSGHAGRARRFLVYEAGPDGTVSEIERLELPPGGSLHDCPASAPHPLDTLDVIVSTECGAGAIRRLEARGVKVVLTTLDDPLEAARQAARGELPVVAGGNECHHGHGHGHGHDHGHGNCGCS